MRSMPEFLLLGSVRGHGPVQTTGEGTEFAGPVEGTVGGLLADDGEIELLHDVAVVVGDPEGFLGYLPARGDDGEIQDGGARRFAVGGGGQDGEETGVVVVE